MSMIMAATREPRKITGKTVIIGMIAFYGVIITVNSLFVFFALDTWPGLTTEDSYKKGLAYNQTIDAATRQSALGWLSNVSVDAAAGADKVVTIRMTGAGNASISGLVVTAKVERAVGTPATQVITLYETAPGRYSGTFKSPAEGRWIAEINAVGPNDAVYRMKHQVMIEP